MEEEAKKPRDAGVDALGQSLDLAKDGQPNEALHILDDAIAQAIEEARGMWVGILCGHAAVLAHAKGDIRREYSIQNRRPHAPMTTSSPGTSGLGVRQETRPLARPLTD